MKTTLALLSALAVLPVYAAEPAPAQPPAAAAPAAAAPAAAAPAAAAPAAVQPAAPAGTVARAQFTSAIQDREPVDKITTLDNDKTQVYFFSEIKDAANHKVTHRWEHDGKVMAEVSFDVGGNRWRVYSLKALDPSWTGEWKVSVVDDAGNTLGSDSFTYQAAKPAARPSSGAPAQPVANAPAAAAPAK